MNGSFGINLNTTATATEGAGTDTTGTDIADGSESTTEADQIRALEPCCQFQKAG